MKKSKKNAEGLVEIVVGTDLEALTDQVIIVLANRAERVFSRGGVLTRVIHDRSPKKGVMVPVGTPLFDPIPEESLQEIISSLIRFISVTYDQHGEEKRRVVKVPAGLARTVLKRNEWPGFRPLTFIAEAPFVRPDGSICQKPGYDPSTGAFCEFSVEFPPMFGKPTQATAKAAAEALLEIVVDFPFAEPHHRSAWLAAMLSVVGRATYFGNTPLFAINANIRGCGKTLLADLIGLCATGRELPRGQYSGDEEEKRKNITSSLMPGPCVVLLDDISTPFGGSQFNRLLTGPVWEDRILGSSKNVKLPNTAIWLITGNNLSYLGDIIRRLVPIKLRSNNERPEERTGFKHDPVEDWIDANRVRILQNCATILSAYILAGKPKQSFSPFGSFEPWSQTIRAALVWCGLADPCAGRVEVNETQDGESNFISAMIHVLRANPKFNKRGATATELLAASNLGAEEIRSAKDPSEYSINVTLHNAVSALYWKGGRLDPQALGDRVASFADRVVGGYKLVKTVVHKANCWRALPADGAEVLDLLPADRPTGPGGKDGGLGDLGGLPALGYNEHSIFDSSAQSPPKPPTPPTFYPTEPKGFTVDPEAEAESF